MSKDYKQGSKRSTSGGKGGSGGSVLTGLFIGLCLGIAIAVAAALYINRIPNPFASKAGGAAPAQPSTARPDAPPEILTPGGAAKPTAPATAAQEPKRFDFYTMLPEPGGEPKSPAKAKPADAVPPATVEPAKGSYLQVGAFQNETDADNLKAKLALMGMEASIQTSEVGEKGVLHRVRIGPLASAADIERLRTQLKLNGMESALIKQ
ncbi:SPOR domain-containing protein [Chitinimonas sp. BJYL2]|uniref:SPOR domain-containing protein n=1 Tax=Chitinimonas sp. BJYL2 TaxID=2976696 RepID=UPI0022B377B4|nr:SPOR domain-containing protein [Chitinimonas sp. BJYL2]